MSRPQKFGYAQKDPASQDNLPQRNYKFNRSTRDRNTLLETELKELQDKMDAKYNQLQDLQDLADKTRPAAHILETVMGELEQRNLELSSLLKTSEKSRLNMESYLKEQNDELTTLRANTLIMRTLEEEISLLTRKKNELLANLEELENDVSECRRKEQACIHHIRNLENERGQMEKQHETQIMDMTSKLDYAHEQLQEKDNAIENMEQTIKDLFDKCNHLGASNTDFKNELINCSESGKELKDMNTKLQFCKDYLESQVDEVFKEVKVAKAENEQLKLEMSNICREKQNAKKQVILLEQQTKQMNGELQIFKDKLDTVQKQLHAYESGEKQSGFSMSIINKEKDSHERTRLNFERKLRDLESQRSVQDEEFKNVVLHGRKMKAEIMELHAKIEYYQEHFIEKQELNKIRSDLEIKHKLDLNTQLQKVSAMFEQEQNELIDAMRNSTNQRKEYDGGARNYGRRSNRTYN